VKAFIYREGRGSGHDRANMPNHVKLGGCSESRWANDIVSSAKANPKIVFHSLDSRHELYDFAYTDSEGFHAFQVTTGKSHTANVNHIKDLQRSVNKGEKMELFLYYLVPGVNYPAFVASPTDPMSKLGVSCKIFHVVIKPPPKPSPDAT